MLAREKEESVPNTPMHLAALFNKIDVLRVLLEHDRSLGWGMPSAQPVVIPLFLFLLHTEDMLVLLESFLNIVQMLPIVIQVAGLACMKLCQTYIGSS